MHGLFQTVFHFKFYFIEKWRRKVRICEYFNGEEKKNLIRTHFKKGRRRCGGRGFSFRDADVVPFTFEVD